MINYYERYEKYEILSKNAADCIKKSSCSNLLEELKNAKTKFNKINSISWDDSVGNAFKYNIEEIINELNVVIEDIETNFTKSEILYLELYSLLPLLKISNEMYQNEYQNKTKKDNIKLNQHAKECENYIKKIDKCLKELKTINNENESDETNNIPPSISDIRLMNVENME